MSYFRGELTLESLGCDDQGISVTPGRQADMGVETSTEGSAPRGRSHEAVSEFELLLRPDIKTRTLEIVLCALAGDTKAQIARYLGVSSSTVRPRSFLLLMCLLNSPLASPGPRIKSESAPRMQASTSS